MVVLHRKKLLEDLSQAGREMSTWTVLFHQAIADQVGLTITDHKCLDLLLLHGPLTAGQLAERTGLTTGAITGVIDRLEKAGYARRERDLHDRRKVIVQPNTESASRDLGPLFSALQQALDPLMASYSDDEIEVVLRYIEESNRVIREQIAQLRGKRAGDK